jgi:hypothetical protein
MGCSMSLHGFEIIHAAIKTDRDKTERDDIMQSMLMLNTSYSRTSQPARKHHRRKPFEMVLAYSPQTAEGVRV